MIARFRIYLIGLFKRYSRRRGFTLIEVLIVLGIIAVLAAIVLVAVNPARQFAEARNTQRQGNVTTILDAIGQRIVDGEGSFSAPFTVIGAATTSCPTLAPQTSYHIESGNLVGAIDLSCLVPTYIPSQLPVDPSSGHWTKATDYDTGYMVQVDANGRYDVWAPGAENETISVTR